MPVIPTDSEIPLYVNDLGVVSCYMGCDDWVPAYDLHTRRTNLADLADVIREHALSEHINTLGR